MSIPTPMNPIPGSPDYASVMTLEPFMCFRIPQIGSLDEFELSLSIVSCPINRAIFARNGTESCMINGSTMNNKYSNWISRRTMGAGAQNGFQSEHRYTSTLNSLYCQLGTESTIACEINEALPPRESLVGLTGLDFSTLTFGLSAKNAGNAFVWGVGTLEFSRLLIRSANRELDIRQDIHGEFWDARTRYHFAKLDMREHFTMSSYQ